MVMLHSIPVPLASESSGELEVPDRRCHPRLGIGFRVVEVDGSVSYFQYASNLSESGLFLAGCLPREIGARVTLLFIPPGTGTRLVIAAEVVANVSAPRRGTSLRFLDDEESPVRVWLRDYIQDRIIDG